MASNRHLGRIVALQSLYEFEFRSQSGDHGVIIDEIVTRNLERYKNEIDDTQFVIDLVDGVGKTLAELDVKLQPIAPEWPLDQIPRIDHTILRMGLYELLHNSQNVPLKVVINESVELAKSFGSDNSSKFINGVLGTAYRTLMLGESDDENSKD